MAAAEAEAEAAEAEEAEEAEEAAEAAGAAGAAGGGQQEQSCIVAADSVERHEARIR